MRGKLSASSFAGLNKFMEKFKDDIGRQGDFAAKSLEELAKDEDLSGFGTEELAYLKTYAMSQKTKRTAGLRRKAEEAATVSGKKPETPTDAEGTSLLDELGIGATFNVEDATEKLNNVEELSKKVLSKDFDLKGTMEKIREKLKEVDFSLFDKEKSAETVKQIAETTSTLEQISKIPDGFNKISTAFNEAAVAIEGLGKGSDAQSVLGRFLVGARNLYLFFDKDTTGMFHTKMLGLTTSIAGSKEYVERASSNAAALEKSVGSLAASFASIKTNFDNMALLPDALNALVIKFDVGFLTNLIALGQLLGPTEESLSIATMFKDVSGLSEVNGSVAEWIDDFTVMLGNLDNLAQSSQFTNLTTVAEAFDQAETDLLTIERVMSGFDQTIKDIKAASDKLSKTDVGEVIKKFYDAMSELNRSLSNVTVGEGGEIRVKLSKIAEGINKASGNFTIQKAPVSVNLTVNVELAVSDVEKTIMKSGRLIRDAFNALADKGGQELSPSGGSFVQKGASG